MPGVGLEQRVAYSDDLTPDRSRAIVHENITIVTLNFDEIGFRF